MPTKLHDLSRRLNRARERTRTLAINSFGQRLRMVTPIGTTVFHYDASGKLIAEMTTTGSTTKTQEYVFLGDMPVAVVK